MDAPEKIYLQVCGDCPQTDCDNCKFSDLEDNVTWCKDRIFNKDVEYRRIDSFVEKAVLWMKRKSAIRYHLSEELIEDFKRFLRNENDND